MRVLHINAGNMYGGVETVLVTLAQCRGLCASVEPEFALCWTGRLSEELLASGVSVHLLGRVRVRNLMSIRRARRRLSELLRRTPFDAVICHMPWSQAIFGAVMRRAKVPLISWMHGPANGRHWVEHLARLTRPDLVIYNSYFISETLQHMYRRTASEVYYYPVLDRCVTYASDERSRLKEHLGSSPNAVIVALASRLDRWKGHRILLEALARLHEVEEWDCWIIGGPQRRSEERYLQELREAATRLGISHRIKFLGQRTEIEKLLALADIYCQPNTEAEPFGVSIVEALHARLPVVTTALGGAIEIVDESCGLLLPPGDIEGLTEALARLIRNRLLRQRLGAAAPVRANKISDPQLQMENLHSILTKAISIAFQRSGLYNYPI